MVGTTRVDILKSLILEEANMNEKVKEHDEIQAIELSDEQLERLGMNVGQHMGASDTTSKHPSGTCRQQC